MGLFDVPAPLFLWLDGAMRPFLPAAVRLAVWGVAIGAVSMLLYARISPQARIAAGKLALARARQRLDDAYDAPMADAWPLIGSMLGTALRQVLRVTWPAVLASLPLLALLVWLSAAYGYALPPPGVSPAVQAAPATLTARWLPGDPGQSGTAPRIVVSNRRGESVADLPVRTAVPTIHKYRWWNALFGNPAGYLPAEAPVDSIAIDLPEPAYLSVGPQWLRGWEPVFFGMLVLTSIGLKIVLRIH